MSGFAWRVGRSPFLYLPVGSDLGNNERIPLALAHCRKRDIPYAVYLLAVAAVIMSLKDRSHLAGRLKHRPHLIRIPHVVPRVGASVQPLMYEHGRAGDVAVAKHAPELSNLCGGKKAVGPIDLAGAACRPR